MVKNRAKILNAVCKYLVLLLVVLPFLAFADTPPIKSVRICGDEAEWPPFLYYQRVNQQKSKQLIGFSLDIIRDILKRHHISVTVVMLPWSRCQKWVKRGDYDMFLNASYNEQRNTDYHLSTGYYQLNYMYYYSNKHYPNGLKIPSKQYVLDNLRQCGIRGSGNSAFEYPPDFVNNLADNWDTLQRLLKTRPELCNFAVVPDAVAVGYIAMGKKYFTDNSLGVGRYPGIAPRSYHIGISRNTPHGKQLLKLINQTLKTVIEDGTYARLRKRHHLPDAIVPGALTPM